MEEPNLKPVGVILSRKEAGILWKHWMVNPYHG